MSDTSYKLTYCVKCRHKTEWHGKITLKMIGNRVPGMHGKCFQCKQNKSTFISWHFYKEELRKG
jgi:hypothetical protein